MSDAQNGSAILAGNPAGSPAADPQTGGAPAASTPPTDNAAPPAASWMDGISDADLKGYVENKGWKDPSELAVGYRNLEKLLGGEKVPLPKGADDAEGWGRVYDALGRPKSAEDYKIPVAEGDDGAFAKTAAAWMHEAGLNQKQAELIASKWNEFAAAQAGDQTAQNAQKTEADLTALRSEWGNAWQENVNLGQRAAKEFGLDAGKLSAIEGAIGTGELLKLMSRIGRGLTEHNFESGRSTTSFGMTPEAARARITDLRGDKEWSGKYLSGNAEAKAELARLMALAYPEAG